MNKIIDHFITMKKRSENSLYKPGDPGRDELGDWMRGYYSGERGAYKHCIKYLRSNRIGKSMEEHSAEEFRRCVSHLEVQTASIKYLAVHGGMVYTDIIEETVEALLELRKSMNYCIRYLRKRIPK